MQVSVEKVLAHADRRPRHMRDKNIVNGERSSDVHETSDKGEGQRDGGLKRIFAQRLIALDG